MTPETKKLAKRYLNEVIESGICSGMRVSVPQGGKFLQLLEGEFTSLMGSKHAVDTPAGQAAYNIAKAGVLALAKSVAVELLDTETTCNALLPSVINTDATRAALPYAEYVNWPQPDDIAQVIDFLASERSKVVNGSYLPVWGSALI